jgi:hypothetical protein
VGSNFYSWTFIYVGFNENLIVFFLNNKMILVFFLLGLNLFRFLFFKKLSVLNKFQIPREKIYAKKTDFSLFFVVVDILAYCDTN